MKKQFASLLILAAIALAQPPQPPGPATPPPPPPGARAPGGMVGMGGMGGMSGRGAPPPPRANRPPMERFMMPGLPGRWWNNPEMVQKLALNSDQQKKMDDIFQQNRLKLIDLNASLQKEEVTLEPLVSADQPEESRILTQIDKVAQSRAELEKANARFLLGIRRVLTPEQWKKLQAETSQTARGMGARLGGPAR